MKIAIAQMNATVGDLSGNAARIVDFAERARRAGADVLVTPELALCGYPPEDLLLRGNFLEACERALADLAGRVGDITVIVGHPRAADGMRFNSASVMQRGRIVGTYDKQQLPNYTVFDEERYFEPGATPLVIAVNGMSFGVNVCEDAWGVEGPAHARSPRVSAGVRDGAWNADAPRL